LAAAAVTLSLVALALVIGLRHFVGPTATLRPGPEAVRQRLEAGREALVQGKYRLALRELEAARALREQHPDALPAADRRRLTQLHRQAALLADLLTEPLEDILRQAADLTDLDEREWQDLFADRYRGRSVIFDARVRAEASGDFQLDYAVFCRDRRVRLELANVQLLHRLPLQQPQRLLLGLRLASVRREAGGGWAIGFEADGAVLLTDPDVAAACCGQPAEEVREVVQRQAEWLTRGP
jgi:hypothetical protein